MQYIIYIVVLTLVQALLLGRIHIMGVATPLIFAYFPMLFRRGTPHWVRLPLCFVTGLFCDIFSNTPGLAASALTLAGFVQPMVLEAFLKREDAPDFRPSIKEMGGGRFFVYALMLTLVFAVAYFGLEVFSFTDPMLWLYSALGSTAITLALILMCDLLRR